MHQSLPAHEWWKYVSHVRNKVLIHKYIKVSLHTNDENIIHLHPGRTYIKIESRMSHVTHIK